MSEVAQAPARGELFVHPNPSEVLLDAAKFDAFYQTIVKETSALVPDTTTQKGRDAIKKVAFKIVKTRTFLDEFGKKLNEDRRKEIGIVDAARRTMRDRLETLKEDVRKPLSDWEEAEEERAQTINDTMAHFRGIAAEVAANKGTVVAFQSAIEAVQQEKIDPAIFGEETIFAENARTIALADLNKGLDAAKQAEADRAELERLRSEAEARRQADAERDRLEASRIAEERRIAMEAADANRREAEAVRAAEVAAKRKADEALAEMERAHQAELAKTEAERQRLEDAERARLAEEGRIASEAETRKADEAIRNRAMLKAMNAIKDFGGIGADRAKKIVLAIAAGEIPHVRIEF